MTPKKGLRYFKENSSNKPCKFEILLDIKLEKSLKVSNLFNEKITHPRWTKAFNR